METLELPALVDGAVVRERRVVEGILLLMLAGLVLVDRGILCWQFLFKYFAQDQALIWYAARELMRGHFQEPCFYGQTYNSCVEGYLAIPLLWIGVPFQVAVPGVTVVLGLLPFWVMAWCAWKRGQVVVAAGALLVPLILPLRYGIETGFPRGFVTGDALAIVPAVLAAGLVVKGRGEGWRYFWIAFLAGVALMLNPGCSLLLVAVAIYCVARFAGRWRFWVFTPLGLLAMVPYPLLVLVFYWSWHDDYRLHHRDMVFPWGGQYFERAMGWVPWAFGDVAPMWVGREGAAEFLLAAFGVVGVFLLMRLRWGLVAGLVAAVALTVGSLAYSRLQMSYASVFLSYSRHFLALPILLVWLVYAAGQMRRMRWVSARWARWGTRGVVVGMVVIGVVAVVEKYRRPEYGMALQSTGPMEVLEIGEAERYAAAIDAAAEREGADMVLLGNYDDKEWAYCLPLWTRCETLYPNWDRRTWRFHEENHWRHERILLIDPNFYAAAVGKGYGHAVMVSRQPAIYAVDTGGRSVVEICRELGVRMREFDEGAE